MRTPPLAVLETWPQPNYVDPVTRGPSLFVVNSIFLFAATVAVAIRLYTRVFIRKCFRLDDWFITCGYVFNVGVVYLSFYAFVWEGWDRHIWDIPLSHLGEAAKYLFAYKLLWAVASASIRLSIISIYYRLLNHFGMPRYRWVLHCNLALVLAILVCFWFTTIFNYIPVQVYWTFPARGQYRSIKEAACFTALSAFNTLSEFVIAGLPIPLVFGGLRISTTQKWGAASLLSLGFFVGIVGSVRTYYAYLVFGSYDHTWWGFPYLICSEVELDTGLICACAPAVSPFFTRLLAYRRKKPSTKRLPTDVLSRSHASSNLSKQPRSTNRTSTDLPAQKRLWSTWGEVYDLEGIATEGFGYKVTITSTSKASDEKRKPCGAKVCKGRLLTRRLLPWTSSHPSQESNVSCKTPNELETVSKGPGPTVPIRVRTAHSLEIRESYHEDCAQLAGFDYRNAKVTSGNMNAPLLDFIDLSGLARDEEVSIGGGGDSRQRSRRPSYRTLTDASDAASAGPVAEAAAATPPRSRTGSAAPPRSRTGSNTSPERTVSAMAPR